MPQDNDSGAAEDPAAAVAGQSETLPPAWRRADRAVLKTTEWSIAAVGVAFTVMITLEVISRYVFDFSIFFINAAARLLLVWFFLLGAGLALRQGGHVGLTLLRDALPPRARCAVVIAGQLLVLVFFAQMLWSGFSSLGPALRQTEAALGVSLFWAMLAFPVGFALLTYHLVTLMYVDRCMARAAETR